MLYNANDLETSVIDEAMALLEGANYLTESESRYYPEMVPIRENDRLGCKLMRIEDLVEYSLANGISDTSIAVHQICEAAKVDPSEIGFTVDEVNLLEDVELEETIRNIIQSNPEVPFFAAPISENDMASVITNAAVGTLAQALDEGSADYGFALFEAYVDNDFQTLLNEDFVVEQIYALGRPNNLNSLNESEDSMNLKIESAINEAYNNINTWDAKKVSALRTIALGLNESGDGDSDLAKYVSQAMNYLSSNLK